jgi:hypothetical protein
VTGCCTVRLLPTVVVEGQDSTGSALASNSLTVGESQTNTSNSRTPPGGRWTSNTGVQYWRGLHERKAPNAPIGVLRIGVMLEKERPPDALWLAWQGKALPADLLWRYYQWRLNLLSAGASTSYTGLQFQTQGACDRWTMLVSLAQWTAWLARPLVEDKPLPWQKAQKELTPGRVMHSLGALFVQIGTPAACCKSRGKSPGWLKGRLRTRPQPYRVVKKTPKRAKSARKAA